MKVIRVIPVLLLAAFLLPGAAAAKTVEVKGPLAIGGHGFLNGELTMELGDEPRPVVFAGKGGYIGLLDLGGDLQVRCAGRGKARSKQTEQGKVYFCIGRAGTAHAVGSHFKFRAFAGHYLAAFPEGTSGTVNGRFVVCRGGDQAAEESGAAAQRRLCRRPSGGGADRERQRPAERQRGAEERGQDDLPTPAELAALLAAKS